MRGGFMKHFLNISRSMTAAFLALPLGTALAAQPKFVPGELLVKFKDNVKAVKTLSYSKEGILSLDHRINHINDDIYVYHSDSKASIFSIIKELKQNPNVEYAEPNYIYYPVEEEGEYGLIEHMVNYKEMNDPRLGDLWGMAGGDIPGVDAFRAWDITRGSRSVKIAVIDTGVDYNHPDLAENIWINEAEFYGEEGVDDDGNGFVDDIHGYDFQNNDGDPMDDHNHGTHCSGTIGALHDNGVGVAGVMGEVQIVPVKFLSASGGTTEDAIKSIDYATSLNVDIMSNSWGGGGFSQALKDAIARAAEKGIIFTAAAGNDAANNDANPHYPSSYELDNIVAVAAHNAQNSLASFSCYGRHSVDISAPGRNILSTVIGGKYASMSGTSMATPHVTGVLGLLVAQEGRMSFADLKERLFATSVPNHSFKRKMVSGGTINAYNLLTDTRPYRPAEPPADAWINVDLDEVFETAHPYASNQDLERVVRVEGAKYIRVVIEKYETEKRYDYLTIKDNSGATIETITGSGENYTTEYVNGDSLTIKWHADQSVTRWGFVIREVQVIYE